MGEVCLFGRKGARRKGPRQSSEWGLTWRRHWEEEGKPERGQQEEQPGMRRGSGYMPGEQRAACFQRLSGQQYGTMGRITSK